MHNYNKNKYSILGFPAAGDLLHQGYAKAGTAQVLAMLVLEHKLRLRTSYLCCNHTGTRSLRRAVWSATIDQTEEVKDWEWHCAVAMSPSST